jgi:YfiR/HmsC-like
VVTGIAPRRLAAAFAIVASLWAPPPSRAAGSAGAEGATASELKAAFLFNFAKFTEWPPDVVRPTQRLLICVARDAGVAAAAERLVKGKAIDGHEVAIVSVNVDRPVDWCHVLYLDGLDGKETARLIESVKSAPVLTVGDGDEFARRGGVAGLVVEVDRMRFVINVAAARRARLALSSKLLGLASIVKDEPNVER